MLGAIVVGGLLGGALCMRLILLPVSVYPRQVTFAPLATVLDLLSHMFLFAMPIVAIVGRAVRARVT